MTCCRRFLLFLLVVHYSSADQGQCSFDSDEGKVLACRERRCRKIDNIYGEHRVLITTSMLRDFSRSYYDVHAYRLCGSEQAGEVTLADAISRGQMCQEGRRSGVFRTVVFEGCREYFNDGSNRALSIFAYTNHTGCNGDLLYRFLLINGTSKINYAIIYLKVPYLFKLRTRF